MDPSDMKTIDDFSLRLNSLIRQNNFFLARGTPQAFELFQLEKEDLCLWLAEQLKRRTLPAQQDEPTV